MRLEGCRIIDGDAMLRARHKLITLASGDSSGSLVSAFRFEMKDSTLGQTYTLGIGTALDVGVLLTSHENHTVRACRSRNVA